MADRLKIEQIKMTFGYDHEIKRDELKMFYKKFNPELKETTFRWMLYDLKKDNIISALDRGVFILNDSNNDLIGRNNIKIKNKKTYKPVISQTLKEIYTNIKKQFPFAELSIWETRWLNEFMVHQPGKFLTIIDTENGTEESIFYHIKSIYKDVYIKPTQNELERYVYESDDSIVIRKLVSQAPVLKQKDIAMPKLEKILVDLFVDKEFYYPYQGKELVNIYNNAVSNYNISAKSLFRYADRRKCKIKLENFLESHDISIRN